MIVRSIDNTLKGQFHTLELEKNGNDNPIKYDGGRLPITYLETYNFLVNETQVLIKDTTNGLYYDVLHANSELTVQSDSQVIGKVKRGQPAVVGSNMNKKQSPAPFCYVDAGGGLNAVVMSDAIWSESVMGWAADGKPNTYSQGILPGGSANHQNQFLRKDGSWSQVSDVYTGSVTDKFIALLDTPLEYTGALDKYLRVSYAEGGSIAFDAIDTSKVPESGNLYYTDARVEDAIAQKTGDRSLLNLAVQQTVSANGFLCDSDARLKADVERLDPAASLSAVLELRPKAYVFKGNQKRRFGLISQEAKRVLPDVVDQSGPFEKINYIDLIPHLIGCIQALKAEVDELKSKSDRIPLF